MGLQLGTPEGCELGCDVGRLEGWQVGFEDGWELGCEVGTPEG